MKIKILANGWFTLLFLLLCSTSWATTPKASSGNHHTISIKSDGTLWAWGNNCNGQLGDSSIADKKFPVKIGTDNNWVSVSAGAFHTLAIKSDGTLWAWGYNSNGQLGDGTTIQKNSPVKIGIDNNWVSVSAGDVHTIAVKTDGSLWAWGYNGNGQLGDSTTIQRNSPVKIGIDNNWSTIDTGSDYTVGIKTDGTLWAWGYNGNGQLGDGTTIQESSPVKIGTDNNWISVSAGDVHTTGIKSNGTLWGWGYNGNGQLGDGTYTQRNSPSQIGTDNKWINISSGDVHTIAVKSDGSLWTWGRYLEYYDDHHDGDDHPHYTQRNLPVQIGTDSNWVSGSAGGFHTLAFKSDGSLWAWGYNGYGQLGDGSNNDRCSPFLIFKNNIGWLSVDAGTDHTLAIKPDGTLWAWGANSSGQLGDGTTYNSLSPIQVGKENRWIFVSAGGLYSVAIKSDGTLWAWGANSSGQLGDGTIGQRYLPIQIGNDNKWISVNAGTSHTMAIKSDGTLWAWGNNDYGQIGDGTIIQKKSPVQIETDNKWISVSAGGSHTMAIKSDGTLWAWGNNGYGQLGDTTIIQKKSPVRIGTDNRWISVDAGGWHTIALKSEGTLWAWGYNGYGQLGIGSTVQKNSPVQIGTINKWISAHADSYHTMAIKSDGTLWAWGYNGFGQLGDGTAIQKKSPIQTGTDNKWVSVDAGGSHTLAIKSDGSLWAWGANGNGQLGDRSTVTRYVPVQIFTGNSSSITIDSSPAGKFITVDGGIYTAPQTFAWLPGSTHTIGSEESQNSTGGAKESFSSWSDSGAETHEIKTPYINSKYTVYYTTQYLLKTSAKPSSSGSITPSCDSGCWYDDFKEVTLTANPSAGSTFVRWSGGGGGCLGKGICLTTMYEPKSISATFFRSNYDVSLRTPGFTNFTGSDLSLGDDELSSAISLPFSFNFFGETYSNIYISSNGFITFLDGQTSGVYGQLLPDAENPNGVVAAFWDDLNPTAGGTIRYGEAGSESDRIFIVEFRDIPHYPYGSPITFQIKLFETSNIIEIHCSSCPSTGASNTQGLEDASGAVASFVSGRNANDFSLTSDAVRFAPIALNVSKAGDGSGTVTSSSAGIDCGIDCSEVYDYNTSVTLTATPSALGISFAGWSGACSGTGTCQVTMDSAKSVTATFIIVSIYDLAVSKAGNGSGTITTSSAGIDCGIDCLERYNYNTSVTLKATPVTGSAFVGWSGACSGTGTTCQVTMSSAKSVTGTFIIVNTLSVSRTGSGSGTVTSAPTGVNCGVDCSESYSYNTTVTLTAAPATGSTFAGWSGACSGTGTCQVAMDSARSVTATFILNTFTLTVSRVGTGNGTITSSPIGINCDGDCSEVYGYNTLVTLTARPATGYTFTGWSGACSGTGTCQVTMDSTKSVTATFTLCTYTLTVSKAGTGSGTITSLPIGISCGVDCSETYSSSTLVTLTAKAASGSSFTGWSGACTGTSTCKVTMDSAKSVTASFKRTS